MFHWSEVHCVEGNFGIQLIPLFCANKSFYFQERKTDIVLCVEKVKWYCLLGKHSVCKKIFEMQGGSSCTVISSDLQQKRAHPLWLTLTFAFMEAHMLIHTLTHVHMPRQTHMNMMMYKHFTLTQPLSADQFRPKWNQKILHYLWNTCTTVWGIRTWCNSTLLFPEKKLSQPICEFGILQTFCLKP